MKRKIFCGTLLLLLCGCSSMNNTESGALGGGLIGAGIGGLIGAVTHRPVEGALIGGALGAGTGALVGNSEDKAEQRQEIRQAQATAAAQDAAARAPHLEDIVAMTQHGVAPSTIIMEIRNSRAFYQLNTQDIVYLKDHGVSEDVINELLSRDPSRAAIPGRMMYGQPEYYYDPYAPPPPVSMGIGVSGGYGYWHR
jgi:hypothetical protein